MDKRVSVYWNPRFRFDSSGKGTVRFFNNDFSKKWNLVVQGIDQKGRIIYFQKVIE